MNIRGLMELNSNSNNVEKLEQLFTFEYTPHKEIFIKDMIMYPTSKKEQKAQTFST